jgi:hypothetical protein
MNSEEAFKFESQLSIPAYYNDSTEEFRKNGLNGLFTRLNTKLTN